MRLSFRIFVSALFVSVSVIFMIVFRAVPAKKLWAGYTVLSVPAGTDASLVLAGLEKRGCKNVICRAVQRVPLDLPQDTPEVSLAAASEADYLLRRGNFFFDKSGVLELYYVPDEYGKNLKAAAAALNAEQKINAAVSAPFRYPAAFSFLCLSFAFFLLFFCRERVLFASFAALPVLYAFCFPSFAAAAAVCLLLCAAFWAFGSWGMKNAARLVLKSREVRLLALFSVVVSWSSGVRGALFFAAAAVSGACAVFLRGQAAFTAGAKYSFEPVRILSAVIRKPDEKNAFYSLAGVSVCSILLFAFALPSFTGGASFARGRRTLFPAARGRGGTFVSLQDFIEWKKEALTYPYISVNSSEFGKKLRFVSIPRYENSGGLIAERFQTVVFDKEFEKNALASIDSLDFPAVEKLLKRQKTLSIGYASPSFQSVSVFTIITFTLSAAGPLFLYAGWKLSGVRGKSSIYRILRKTAGT
ncbi:MAG: hypothetical protein ACTTKL_02230 [Treponema sp.]